METEMEAEMEILSLACEIIFGEIDVQARRKQFCSGTATVMLKAVHRGCSSDPSARSVEQFFTFFFSCLDWLS